MESCLWKMIVFLVLGNDAMRGHIMKYLVEIRQGEIIGNFAWLVESAVWFSMGMTARSVGEN